MTKKEIQGPGLIENISFAPGMASNSLEVFRLLRNEYGPIYTFSIPRKFIVICEPDYIQHILKDNWTNYIKSDIYNEIKPVLGKGLVTSEGNFWKRQRRIISPEFSMKHIKGFYPVFRKHIENYIKDLADLDTTDMGSHYMHLTFMIAGEAFFGSSVERYTDAISSSLYEVQNIAIDKIYSLFNPPMWIPTPRNSRYKKMVEIMDTVTYDLIREYEQDSPEIENTLSRLLKAKDPETGESMSKEQLRDEVLTLLLAGHETTSNALLWTTYCLAKNPDVKAKLIAEIDDKFGKEIPSIDDLDKVLYLKMVIQEGMRHYPPVPVISRTPIKDDIIDGFTIPAGSVIMCPQYVVHKDERFWHEPEKFDPERFTEDAIKNRHRMAYFPFADGPRRCIGDQFAMIESQLILASLLQSYDFDLVAGFEPRPHSAITLISKNGLQLKLRKR